MLVTVEEGCRHDRQLEIPREGHLSFVFLLMLLSGRLQFWLLKLMVSHLPLPPSTMFLDYPSCTPLDL